MQVGEVDAVSLGQLVPGQAGGAQETLDGLVRRAEAEALRAERPGTPIILATGFAELPQEAPADLTKLAKPFRQSDLAYVIGQVVERAGRPG